MNETDILENVSENLQNSEEVDTSAEVSLSEPSSDEDKSDSYGGEVDYSAVVLEDLKILREEFAELASISDICELNNPLRYAALRDLGLSPVEAYLATAKRVKKDNRSHLVATRTVSVEKNGAMSDSELAAAREIFSGISDRELRKLYKRVTK